MFNPAQRANAGAGLVHNNGSRGNEPDHVVPAPGARVEIAAPDIVSTDPEIPADMPAFEACPPVRRKHGDVGGWTVRSNLTWPACSSGTPGGLFEAVLEILERGEPDGRRFRGNDWQIARDDDDLYGPARLRDHVCLRLQVLSIGIDRRRAGAVGADDLLTELSQIVALAAVGIEMLQDARGQAIPRAKLFALASQAADRIDEAARLAAHDLTLDPNEANDQ
jgi:hypothetical protein